VPRCTAAPCTPWPPRRARPQSCTALLASPPPGRRGRWLGCKVRMG
jgi:hypothetical protein